MEKKNEKILDLRKTLENIQSKINEVYPFNIVLKLNPDKPQNGFIITIDKKAYKKHGKEVLEEIFKYFHEEFRIKAELIYEKRRKPFLSREMHIYYLIKVD